MAKERMAWHTDIVVEGQGMNVKVSRGKGCARLILHPDVPGRKSAAAKARFLKAAGEKGSSCSITSVKKSVEHAVRKTKARWNRWHHESY